MANAQIVNLNNRDKKYISEISSGEEYYLIKDAALTEQVERINEKLGKLENIVRELETITRLLVERIKQKMI